MNKIFKDGQFLFTDGMMNVPSRFETVLDQLKQMDAIEYPDLEGDVRKLINKGMSSSDGIISRIGQIRSNKTADVEKEDRRPLSLRCTKDGKPYIQVNSIEGKVKTIPIPEDAVPYYDTFLRSFSTHVCGVQTREATHEEFYEEFSGVPDKVRARESLVLRPASLENAVCEGMARSFGAFNSENGVKYLTDFLSIYLPAMAECSIDFMAKTFEQKWGEAIYDKNSSEHYKFAEFMSEYSSAVCHFAMGDRMLDSLDYMINSMSEEMLYTVGKEPPKNINANVSEMNVKLGDMMEMLFAEKTKEMGDDE